MPTISSTKKDKITEQIMHYLFSVAPESKFTSDIARETARDEEFILSLLKELKDKSLIVQINKNALGADYLKRKRWRLSNEAFQAYSSLQRNNKPFSSS